MKLRGLCNNHLQRIELSCKKRDEADEIK